MGTKFPYILQVGEKAKPNIKEPICIYCKNSATTVSYGSLTVKQIGNCLDKLKKKEIGVPKFKTLSW